MVRVKRGVTTRKKHKKVMKATKGMKGVRTSSIKKAKEALAKALSYSYRDRRTKKREFRSLWIIRLNNALDKQGISYSSFIKMLKDKKIEIDRKILSDIAVNNPDVFDKVVEEVKK